MDRYKIGAELDVSSVVKEGEDFTDPAKRREMKSEVKKLFTEKYSIIFVLNLIYRYRQPDPKSEKWDQVKFFFRRLRF